MAGAVELPSNGPPPPPPPTSCHCAPGKTCNETKNNCPTNGCPKSQTCGCQLIAGGDLDPRCGRTTINVCNCATSSSGGGAAAAQAGSPTLIFKNSSKLKISIKVDKIGYRKDIDPAKSDIVPASKLQNVDPKDQSIAWEAYPADLKSPQQTRPNSQCDGGKIKFDDKGTAAIEVKGKC